MEMAAEEVVYKVDRITGMRWTKGAREYLVMWEGYASKDSTWEPMGNLVGCATQIREYENQREAQDKEAKEDILRKRQEKKDKAETDAAALRQAAAAAIVDLPDGGTTDGAENHDGGACDSNHCLKIHKGKRTAVWKAYDLSTLRPSCKLAKEGAKDSTCGVTPSDSAGTTNYWAHLWSHHRVTWYELKKQEGSLNCAGEVELEKLKKAFASNITSTGEHGEEFKMSKLQGSAKQTMDRVTAEWIVDQDQALNAAATPGFKRMMGTATTGMYVGCSEKTVKQNVTCMAVEGKAECTEFHRDVLASGTKPAASGDLWSKNGTALFGLVSHGIRRREAQQTDGTNSVTWEMGEKLAGAVPCNSDRHTGEHIAELSNEAWSETGIKKPVEELFARVSDNGSNMIKGWPEGFQIPCCDHTIELSVNLYTGHDYIAPTFEKGRGQVGYFNMSNIGYTEEGVGLHACQRSAGAPENRLTQDVKTRWRSTHDMANTLRINNEPLLLYDVRNPNPAKGFTNNRYSLEDWTINNQSVALLAPLATASKYLEGKKYPTSNLVMPSIYGCIELLHADAAIRQPWDNKLLQPWQLRPEVTAGRAVLYEDLERRWKTELSPQLERFYFIATICDPRQKGLRFPGVNPGQRASAHAWFEAEYESLWAPKPIAPSPAATGPRTTTPPAHPQHAGASFLDFMANLSHLPGAALQQDCGEEDADEVESEAARYLASPDVAMGTDILVWWACHETEYPCLSVMARQYLGVPATSASAERLFSIAGRVFDDLRQGVCDKVLEERIWAKINCEGRKAK